MARKVYLDWEDVPNLWEMLNVNWEDIYVLIPSGGSQYYRDNPWDKPWNKPGWSELNESEKEYILERYKKKI